MALTFYYGSGSPFAWRVWLALEHKGVPYEFRMLSFSKGDTRSPEYLQINPRGKVPAIVDGDFALYESNAIVEYLDERFPQAPKLFPGDLKQRAIVRRFVNELDSYLAPANEKLIEQIFFKKPDAWDANVIEEGRADVHVELARLEDLVHAPFVAGELSAADFVLAPLLAMHKRLELRKPDLGLVAARGPNLAAIANALEALPVYNTTIPPHWK
jgi:glutathione S-transferase